MSLINDALKRTKDAQQQNPPPAGGPPLKVADSAGAKSASGAKTLLYIMVACVIVGNALLFIAIKDRGVKKEAAPAIATGSASAQPATATTTPVPTVAAAAPAVPVATAAPAPVAAANPAPVATPIAAETNSTEVAPVVAAQPEPPKPAPLKLQSIIYNPSRPSAMVSSKFVFIGDKVQGFRVTAIDQETVTLVGNGQTNVLSLP